MDKQTLLILGASFGLSFLAIIFYYFYKSVFRQEDANLDFYKIIKYAIYFAIITALFEVIVFPSHQDDNETDQQKIERVKEHLKNKK